jgi:GDPmannose 4,6-dehydratase
MHRILQADEPGDFVLATGETRSVREFVELAFAEVGRSIEWRGKGIEETGIDRKSGKTVVRIDPTYFRSHRREAPEQEQSVVQARDGV